MTNLFGVDIAGIIHGAISPGVPSLSLTKVSPGARTGSAPTAGINPTSATHSGRGFMDTYRAYEIDGSIVTADSRRIVIIGNSLPSGVIPAVGDLITLEGVIWTIESVRRDPAAAIYDCRVGG